jgi:hypothetical protein
MIKKKQIVKCHKKEEEAPLVSGFGVKEGRFYQCKVCGKWLTNDPFYIQLNKTPDMFDGMSNEKIIKIARDAAKKERK